MAEKILEVQNLKKTFLSGKKSFTAVEDVSFFLNAGEVLGIVGESGSGKSMTALAIAGLLSRHDMKKTGEILFEGTDLLHCERSFLRELQGNDISVVFQEPMTSLNPVFTVGEQIAESIRLHQNASREEAMVEAKRMLDQVRIPEAQTILSRYPHQLSGGMRQRVMIAMAMVCKPKLLIADEPTTALDVTIEAQILRLMKELRDETGMSVLIITHNMGVVAEICDYVYVMYAGKIMEQAETFELFYHTMHPYTKGLLDSIPRIGQNAERLHTIPGVVPNLLHLSQGCPFSNRCEYATDQCRTEKAQLHPVAPDHQVRCFRCEEEHQ